MMSTEGTLPHRSIYMIAHPTPANHRKHDLVTLGGWAMATGRGWLVTAVQRALVREGLTHA
jgi:hypothetical protein